MTAYSVFIFVVSSVFLAPNVAPSDVGGGGGSNRELTITWMVSNALRWNEAFLGSDLAAPETHRRFVIGSCESRICIHSVGFQTFLIKIRKKK